MPAIVIVGASLTGASAAATLRSEGFDGEIVLVGDEPHLPYERPPLSKQYLRGQTAFEKALVRPAAFYQDNRIRMELGVRATRVVPAGRAIELADGRRLAYDKLLLATGGRNRRLDVPGSTLAGIHGLRTVDEANAIRGEIGDGRRAVVVGMGFIGCEVAASLREQGLEVAAVEMAPTPLQGALGRDVGRVIAALHQERGVQTLFGETVVAFEGADRVEGVVTNAGRRLACDFAVVGIGIEPDVSLVEGTGIETANGIVVDEYCRTTVEGVYAAGDVANHSHPGFGRLRVEHWQNAIKQGAAAARSMLGRGEPYDEVHWFWSDQFDLNLQYAGGYAEWDQQVVRGSLADRQGLVFYLRAGRLVAAAALNRGRDLRRCLPLVKARAAVAPEALADESVDLRGLA